MGYDVHITRRAEWCGEEELPIWLEEWLTLVDADPDLRLDGYAEAELPDGSVFGVEEPSLAVWTAHPDPARSLVWIWHNSGNVVAKDPDEFTRQKMWQIAQRLHARVQGDELELYGPDGRMIPE